MVKQGKSYIIAKTNVWALFRNKQKLQILSKLWPWILMSMMSKTEYLILPKEKQNAQLGKLRLSK